MIYVSHEKQSRFVIHDWMDSQYYAFFVIDKKDFVFHHREYSRFDARTGFGLCVAGSWECERKRRQNMAEPGELAAFVESGSLAGY